MQDIEFTFEKEKLYILQTRNGKRTAAAAVKIAVDMVSEGVCSKEEALQRVEPAQLTQLLHQGIDPSINIVPVAKGLPASPGAAVGKVVLMPILPKKGQKEKMLSVRSRQLLMIFMELLPQGVLTNRGGMTSHARCGQGDGKPCVSGCENLKIDLEGKISA